MRISHISHRQNFGALSDDLKELAVEERRQFGKSGKVKFDKLLNEINKKTKGKIVTYDPLEPYYEFRIKSKWFSTPIIDTVYLGKFIGQASRKKPTIFQDLGGFLGVDKSLLNFVKKRKFR